MKGKLQLFAAYQSFFIKKYETNTRTYYYNTNQTSYLVVTRNLPNKHFFPLAGCGSVVNNSLKSPGYPNNYPSDMHCVYSIPIPQGMALNISFKDFILEDEEYLDCQ